MKNFIAIDFETANYHPTSICSVGMVFVENQEIVQKTYALIRPLPNYYIDRFTDIHGLSYSETLSADTFDQFWKSIEKQIQDIPLIVHNKSFDQTCLIKTLEAYEIAPIENDFFCTMRLARKKLPHLENHKLKTVANYCGYNLQNHHHALADAEACAAIAIKLF